MAFSGLSACATMAERGTNALRDGDVRKEISHALPPESDTGLRRMLAGDVARHSGMSGFRVFSKGEDSLYARLALIRAAEKAIDLQYYAVANDATSNLMLEGIILAAERGVRVRMLIDGFTVSKIKEGLTALDGVHNIEVRVFNPVGFAHEGIVYKAANAIAEADQVNRRMHNKALISDSQMAIIGGRNLGDEYFDAHTDISFKDIDILTAGPVTADISKSFDEYWNDESSYPIEAVYEVDHKAAKNAREKLAENWSSRIASKKNVFNYDRPVDEIFRDERISLSWAKAKFTADDPLKVIPEKDNGQSATLQKLVDIAGQAEHEFIAVSSYFVPTERGVEWLGNLHDRGVRIRILTNSLASTDVVAVHSGYKQYRKDLLRRGIELYEFKPINKDKKQRILARTSPPKAGLHAKVYIVDERYTMVGSFNMDPRSANLNTELMLLIDSHEIAQRLKRGFEASTDPTSSYRLALEGNKGDENLVWIYEDKGQMKKDTSEPAAGIGRRIQNFMFSLFPLEENL